MRFRFCGDLDCPDWVLAEISTLAKLTSVKAKLLCNQVLSEMVMGEMDYDKIGKLVGGTKFEAGDVKASIAVLYYILSSAARNNVDGNTLSNEIQQLGLPKEHSTSVCKSYTDQLSELQRVFCERSLRLSRLVGVEWRVDYIIGSSELRDVGTPCVQLKLSFSEVASADEIQHLCLTLSAEKFHDFLKDMKQAQGIMESVEC